LDQSCHNRNGGFSTFHSQFQNNNLQYFIFHAKSKKTVKAVIQLPPFTISAEDISDWFVTIGFDVISAKQISVTRQSRAEETTTANIPIFFITLPGTSKSENTFELP
jgi:hypothetical protein